MEQTAIQLENKITLRNFLRTYPDIIINDSNEEVINAIFNYFKGVVNPAYSLDKGILLTGSIGIGKTTLLKRIYNFQRIKSLQYGGPYFEIMDCRHILREFLIDGFKVADKYGRKSFYLKHCSRNGSLPDLTKPRTYCFDDLGLEEANSKIYGNSQSIMAEIMLDRYTMFKDYGMITHAISNLSVDNLIKVYGDRTADRFKEMFNHFILTGPSFRK